eukprot:1156927-Pelagomonas_calceolata.AAC.8
MAETQAHGARTQVQMHARKGCVNVLPKVVHFAHSPRADAYLRRCIVCCMQRMVRAKVQSMLNAKDGARKAMALHKLFKLLIYRKLDCMISQLPSANTGTHEVRVPLSMRHGTCNCAREVSVVFQGLLIFQVMALGGSLSSCRAEKPHMLYFLHMWTALHPCMIPLDPTGCSTCQLFLMTGWCIKRECTSDWGNGCCGMIVLVDESFPGDIDRLTKAIKVGALV